MRKIQITDWVTNSKMRDLLKQISEDTGKEELRLNMNQLSDLLEPDFKQVKDCVVIAKKSVAELEEGLPKAIKMYMDKTGYEAANTETRINTYFDNKISMEAGTKIALMILDIWSLVLKKLEPDSQFCFIMCSDENRVEIRFHKVRDNEKRLLANDLESYKDGAVGYVLV